MLYNMYTVIIIHLYVTCIRKLLQVGVPQVMENVRWWRIRSMTEVLFTRQSPQNPEHLSVSTATARAATSQLQVVLLRLPHPPSPQFLYPWNPLTPMLPTRLTLPMPSHIETVKCASHLSRIVIWLWLLCRMLLQERDCLKVRSPISIKTWTPAVHDMCPSLDSHMPVHPWSEL